MSFITHYEIYLNKSQKQLLDLREICRKYKLWDLADSVKKDFADEYITIHDTPKGYKAYVLSKHQRKYVRCFFGDTVEKAIKLGILNPPHPFLEDFEFCRFVPCLIPYKETFIRLKRRNKNVKIN